MLGFSRVTAEFRGTLDILHHSGVAARSVGGVVPGTPRSLPFVDLVRKPRVGFRLSRISGKFGTEFKKILRQFNSGRSRDHTTVTSKNAIFSGQPISDWLKQAVWSEKHGW